MATLLSGYSVPAQAIDKKVTLMFKTAGYGIAAGLLVGAATWTMGIGTSKNMLTGASLGLYAGIILGGYILLTQNDQKSSGPRNPWAPGRPVGPDDWKDIPEGEIDGASLIFQQKKIGNYDIFERMGNGGSKMTDQNGLTNQVAVWSPLVAVRF